MQTCRHGHFFAYVVLPLYVWEKEEVNALVVQTGLPLIGCLAEHTIYIVKYHHFRVHPESDRVLGVEFIVAEEIGTEFRLHKFITHLAIEAIHYEIPCSRVHMAHHTVIMIRYHCSRGCEGDL